MAFDKELNRAKENEVFLQENGKIGIDVNKNNFMEKPKGKEKHSQLSRIRRQIHKNLLLILTLVGVTIGVAMGFIARRFDLTKDQISYLAFPGELFMRALKMIILPLIVSSIVCGLAGMDIKLSGRLGLRAIVYYMVTTVLSVITGIFMAITIQPGSSTTDIQGNSTGAQNGHGAASNAGDAFLDLLRNMFPENIIQATFKQYKTERVEMREVDMTLQLNNNNITGDVSYNTTQLVAVGGYHNGLNVLGLILFSALFGIFLGRIGKKGDVVTKFFYGFNEVIMRMVGLIMWCSPLGIAFLIAGKIAEVDQLEEIISKLALYVATVLTGTLLHGFVTLPLIYFVLTRKNPFKFIAGMSQALITAWATASSSATLPVTFKCIEENNKIDKRVSRFMLPVGATVNMDGGGVYEAVSALFIAQMQGYPVSFGTIVTISTTATASSIGAAGVPHAALVTIIIVLQACGLPVTDVPLLLAVDWLLDRFRTMINVFGDAIGAGVVDHLSRKELREAKQSDDIDLDDSVESIEYTSNDEDISSGRVTIVNSVSVV